MKKDIVYFESSTGGFKLDDYYDPDKYAYLIYVINPTPLQLLFMVILK